LEWLFFAIFTAFGWSGRAVAALLGAIFDARLIVALTIKIIEKRTFALPGLLALASCAIFHGQGAFV